MRHPRQSSPLCQDIVNREKSKNLGIESSELENLNAEYKIVLIKRKNILEKELSRSFLSKHRDLDEDNFLAYFKNELRKIKKNSKNNIDDSTYLTDIILDGYYCDTNFNDSGFRYECADYKVPCEDHELAEVRELCKNPKNICKTSKNNVDKEACLNVVSELEYNKTLLKKAIEHAGLVSILDEIDFAKSGDFCLSKLRRFLSNIKEAVCFLPAKLPSQ